MLFIFLVIENIKPIYMITRSRLAAIVLTNNMNLFLGDAIFLRFSPSFTRSINISANDNWNQNITLAINKIPSHSPSSINLNVYTTWPITEGMSKESFIIVHTSVPALTIYY